MGEPGPLKGSWEFPYVPHSSPCDRRSPHCTLHSAGRAYIPSTFLSLGSTRGAEWGPPSKRWHPAPLSGPASQHPLLPRPPEFLVHCSAPCLPPPSFLE